MNMIQYRGQCVPCTLFGLCCTDCLQCFYLFVCGLGYVSCLILILGICFGLVLLVGAEVLFLTVLV